MHFSQDSWWLWASLSMAAGCLVCFKNSKISLECSLCIYTFKYNFQQRISWLSHRWRTQRNAISNVNCRIQWIIESLNAPCAPWYSEEHACLSVMVFSILSAFAGMILDLEVIAGILVRSAPLKCISVNIHFILSVIIIYAVREWWDFMLQTVARQSLWLLTSNQVGLPAELKHINKRRKRN